MRATISGCRRRLFWLIGGIIVLVCIAPASGQSVSGFYDLPDSTNVDRLVNRMRRQSNLARLTAELFGASENHNLPDLIFFFDRSSDGCDVRLVQQKETRCELYGEKYIHILAFAIAEVKGRAVSEPESRDESSGVSDESSSVYVEKERRIATGRVRTKQIEEGDVSTSADTVVTLMPLDTPSYTMQLSITQLGYKKTSGELTVVHGVSTIATSLLNQPVSSETASAPTRDTNLIVPMEVYDTLKSGAEMLLWAYRKVRLSEGTVNRVTVRPAHTRLEGAATFGNYSASRLGLSVSVVSSFADQVTQRREGLSDWEVNGFLLGHVYLFRPNIPTPHFNSAWSRIQHRISLSLVGGPRLSDDLFDDFFLGVSCAHVIGSLGFVVGGTWRQPEDKDGNDLHSSRRWYLGVGLNYIM